MTSPATFNTPAGWLDRCTLADNKVEHQIRLSGYAPGTTVSCNCCRVVDHRVGGLSYTLIGVARSLDEAWAIYKDFHASRTV